MRISAQGQDVTLSEFWPVFLSATFENWQSEWLNTQERSSKPPRSARMRGVVVATIEASRALLNMQSMSVEQQKLLPEVEEVAPGMCATDVANISTPHASRLTQDCRSRLH